MSLVQDLGSGGGELPTPPHPPIFLSTATASLWYLGAKLRNLPIPRGLSRASTLRLCSRRVLHSLGSVLVPSRTLGSAPRDIRLLLYHLQIPLDCHPRPLPLVWTIEKASQLAFYLPLSFIQSLLITDSTLIFQSTALLIHSYSKLSQLY